MNQKQVIPVFVSEIKQLTPIIKQFTLTAKEGELPHFSGGSHLVVTMDSKPKKHKNPYSVVSISPDRKSYVIAIRRDENGRGGSMYMHDQVEVGSELEISAPYNLFPLYPPAQKHILIAGGVGVTPIMGFMKDMPFMIGDYEVHYARRSEEHGGFDEPLKEMVDADRLHFYNDAKGIFLDIRELMSDQPLGTHVYVCGPTGMINAVLDAGKELGWPDGAVHYEIFKSHETGKPFVAKIASTGQEIHVSEDESLLEALERSQFNIDYLCRGGACGFCKTAVVDGVPEHRDYFLNDQEKESNKFIMPCVSRCQGNQIVLAL